MTNPNPKFYKYKNTKINQKENKNKRETEKTKSTLFILDSMNVREPDSFFLQLAQNSVASLWYLQSNLSSTKSP